MDWLGDEIIRFHDGRCGKAEEAHKILKEDFAGGQMPSDEFGANAAWWAIPIDRDELERRYEPPRAGGSLGKQTHESDSVSDHLSAWSGH